MKQNSKCKLIVFSDIHYLDILSQQTWTKNGRKLVHYAIPVLTELISKINNIISPDIAINLGDLIQDSNNHNKDIDNIKFIWNELKKIKCPFFSAIGNHDLKTMNSREEVEKILGYKHSTFSIDINGYHFILLGTDLKNEIGIEQGGIRKTQSISDKDLEWIKNDLSNNQLPCLIFTHFGIAEDNMEKNWWFEKNPQSALLTNRMAVKQILKNDKNVIAVFSGHQHWTKMIKEDGISYYVVGSLIENINNDGIPDGVYFEVNLEAERIDVIEHHISLNRNLFDKE